MNLALELPADMNTVEGTDNADELLLDTEKERPAEGAADPDARLIVTSVVAPATTLDGEAVTVPNASGAGEAAPVEFSKPAKPGLAPVIGNTTSGLPSRLKSPVTSVPPPTLELDGGAK